MSQLVYKYPLQQTLFQELSLPVGAKILSIQLQNDIPTMWCQVETDEKEEIRYFARIMTGFEEVPRGAKHLATLQQGWYVTHWYECFCKE